MPLPRPLARARLLTATVGLALLTSALGGPMAAPAAAQVEGPERGPVARVATAEHVIRHGDRAGDASPSRKGPRRQEQDRQDRQDQKDQQADLDIALAATWQPDPELLEVQPGDSDATATARQRLAEVVSRLQRVLDEYDRAHAEAERAQDGAAAAAAALERAEDELAAARRAFRRDKDLLLDAMTGAYTTGSLGALGMLLTADTDEDLVTGMTVLKQLTRSQSDAVVAADRSRDRLRRAQVAVAEADREARRRLHAARTALTRAARSREAVLRDVEAARRLLRSSVLADQAAVAEASGGYRGSLSFPLRPDATFVDQDNWGHRSGHWASSHTGDDLSTACGTPVLAANDGTVLVRTDQGWAGPWLVMVQSGSGELTTWYAHMQALRVSDGERVEAGQQLGWVGQQGNATGCHLHFEVHPDGGSIYQDDTDPAQWLRDVGVYPGVS